MVCLSERFQEAGEGWVLIVLLPARREGDVAGTRRIAKLAKADAGIGKGGPRLDMNADMKSCLDHPEDLLIAGVPGLNLGGISRRREFPEDQVAKIKTRVPLT